MAVQVLSTCLLVALHYFKYTHNLSDEKVVQAWVENPYWQVLAGMKWFEHKPSKVPESEYPVRIGPFGCTLVGLSPPCHHIARKVLRRPSRRVRPFLRAASRASSNSFSVMARSMEGMLAWRPRGRYWGIMLV